MQFLQPVRASEEWAAAVIPLTEFPASEREREILRTVLVSWVRKMSESGRLTIGTWLQMQPMHKGKGARTLSSNAKRWLPETGLGIWPDREPPRLWSDDDFVNREWGAPLPALMHTVFHVAGSGGGSLHALETMIGSGAVICVLTTAGSTELYHEEMRELLLPNIMEEAFLGHPFYIPLLEARSIESPREQAGTSRLGYWMGSAQIYIRESPEDGGVLVICRDSQVLWTLDGALERAAVRQSEVNSGER